MKQPKSEIREDDQGELDEVFARGRVHLERMDRGVWWMRVDIPGENSIVVNFWTKGKAKIFARAERD